MSSSSYLLQMLLAVLATNGVMPEVAEPWDTWRGFKQFVRIVDEVPDPGVSVQLYREGESANLVFLRQVVEGPGDWLEPVGGVVCELRFSNFVGTGEEWEIWTFDFPSLETFVDAAEQHPDFADLMIRFPEDGSVFWQSLSESID